MKVIIAEDDLTTRATLSGLVGKMGYECISVENGVQALQAYNDLNEPCLLLVDWEMPELDGISLCQQIKAMSKLNPPYIILVTGRVEPKDIVEGLEQGADDYICKPFNAPELIARIQVAKRTLDLHMELEKVRNKLKHQADHDGLTGLLNRRAAMKLLSSEANRCIRANENLHVAISDIDNFKAINDRYGHSVGDRVIQQVSASMSECFRDYDILARYGGEEFLIAINSDAEEVDELFERLRQHVESTQIDIEGGESIHVTMSIGGCSLVPDLIKKSRLVDILSAADECLYRAKSAGKNCIIWEVKSGPKL